MARKPTNGSRRRKSRSPKPPAEKSTEVMPVVGVGASAGGISAFQLLVKNIPKNTGIAWVLILHMAPDHESNLDQILARCTPLPVTEVIERTALQPDSIYVIAPGHTMTLADGVLQTVADRDLLARRSSIDAFFLSLAEQRREHSGCALLSGAGTDGTIGLKAVKEAGGLTLTQTLDSAEYDSMLLSAVQTGLVDRELPIENIPSTFVDFLIRHQPIATGEAIDDGDRMRICQVVHKGTGHDFSDYKSNTIDRRIRRRMQMLGLEGAPAYLRKLDEDKKEATLLFRDLLIGVTQFFRDQDAFQAIANEVIPKILEGKTADDEIRIWSVGCATGEETYTLAMLLQERASSLESVPTLRVFGTDIDENALHFARVGRYPKGIAADITPERLDQFFEKQDGTYVVKDGLREICLFAQHNVLRDPPFSRIDLIVCRNVLIYLNATLQTRLIPVFHYALKGGGFLFLGPAENASDHADQFKEINRKQHIFHAIGDSHGLPAFPITRGDGADRSGPHPTLRQTAKESEALTAEVTRQMLAPHTPPYVLINAEFDILDASQGTGDYLELPTGKPNTNLTAMARSGLAVDIRTAVTKVMTSGKSVTHVCRGVGTGDAKKNVTMVVEPVRRPGVPEPLYLVLFKEARATDAEDEATDGTDRDADFVRALEWELQTTKERLQTTLEELETSNEELKASNEEISSVNEELQSSNEELETSKEELQSINEELRTVNNELSTRVDELGRANNDLKNLFANADIPMLFLDEKLRIMNFTPVAKTLFRLRDHDMGRPLDELAGRFDELALKDDVETVLRTNEHYEREVQTNGGDCRTYIMRLLPYRDTNENTRGVVLTFIDITQHKRSEERLASMVSELNHRVKNSMASVQAIVQQTAARASSVDQLTETLLGRVQAMAAAHNIISETDWAHAGLHALAASVLEPFAEDGSDRLKMTGPPVQLQSRVAVALGMILNELATNAAKYGAWSSATGYVTLRWELVKNDGGLLRFVWEEEGGPATKTPDERGFGTQFIQRSTQFELQGHCNFDFLPQGLRYSLELAAENVLIHLSEDDS